MEWVATIAVCAAYLTGTTCDPAFTPPTSYSTYERCQIMGAIEGGRYIARTYSAHLGSVFVPGVQCYPAYQSLYEEGE